MTHDLLIRNGRLAAGGAPVDIAIRGGRIAAIGAGLAPEGSAVEDAGGALVSPGFVEAHTHLDKSLWGMGWHPNSAGPRLIDKIDNERRLKKKNGGAAIPAAPVAAIVVRAVAIVAIVAPAAPAAPVGPVAAAAGEAAPVAVAAGSLAMVSRAAAPRLSCRSSAWKRRAIRSSSNHPQASTG